MLSLVLSPEVNRSFIMAAFPFHAVGSDARTTDVGTVDTVAEPSETVATAPRDSAVAAPSRTATAGTR